MTLPQGSKSVQVDKPKGLTIRMDKDKNIYLKKDTFTKDTFADDFTAMTDKYNKSSEVHIQADETLMYGDVMYLLKSVKAAGFDKVSLITE
jgi:biopolymer transport protein ExbD